MKYLLVILCILISIAGYARQTTTVILVRHAEKAFATDGDPVLTDEGEKRAQELKRVLAGVEINEIYSTPFKRTRLTVAPLAEEKGLEIMDYNPFKTDEILEVVQSEKGKTILISGHSNTIPALLNTLVGDDRYNRLDEADYDNLYVVSLTKSSAKVLALEYGADSPL